MDPPLVYAHIALVLNLFAELLPPPGGMGISEHCLTESKPSSLLNTSSFTKPGNLVTPVPDTWPLTFAKQRFQVSCYGQVQILSQLKCSSHITFFL